MVERCIEGGNIALALRDYYPVREACRKLFHFSSPSAGDLTEDSGCFVISISLDIRTLASCIVYPVDTHCLQVCVLSGRRMTCKPLARDGRLTMVTWA
jgi:hypothetical protein